MSASRVIGLQARVRSCLQIILDLESDLHQAGMVDTLLQEFREIKNLIRYTHHWNLKESDVLCIERATADFLGELEIPLSVRSDLGTVFRVQ